jgi:predicted DNA-binding antitoxin AbrB/MazE fold protein
MGYILMETSYWNGDIVLKPFKLNKVNFKKGEQFACADAINIKNELTEIT